MERCGFVRSPSTQYEGRPVKIAETVPVDHCPARFGQGRMAGPAPREVCPTRPSGDPGEQAAVQPRGAELEQEAAGKNQARRNEVTTWLAVLAHGVRGRERLVQGPGLLRRRRRAPAMPCAGDRPGAPIDATAEPRSAKQSPPVFQELLVGYLGEELSKST